MPAYLFTLHAYRSWRPDHRRGFVRRGEGVLPPDVELARAYDERALQAPVLFDAKAQQVIIDAAIESCQHQSCRLHAVFFERSHVHLVVSWTLERGWQRVRNGLKSSMTRRLNNDCGVRQWFGASGSRRQIKDRKHFNHLIGAYRTKHQGLHWVEVPSV